ncbi:hypothetical protein BgiMline_016617, partial [Biomphalaria glabrata]
MSICVVLFSVSITHITGTRDCVPGDPDLIPELCTNSSICQTEPSLCCNYCFPQNSTTSTSATKLISPI